MKIKYKTENTNRVIKPLENYFKLPFYLFVFSIYNYTNRWYRCASYSGRSGYCVYTKDTGVFNLSTCQAAIQCNTEMCKTDNCLLFCIMKPSLYSLTYGKIHSKVFQGIQSHGNVTNAPQPSIGLYTMLLAQGFTQWEPQILCVWSGIKVTVNTERTSV